MKGHTLPGPNQKDRKEPTYEGTDEYREKKDISKKEFKDRGINKTNLKDLRSSDKNVDLDKAENMPVKTRGFGPSTAFGGVKNPELTKGGPTKKGPCWKGYEMIGMKKKGGRNVPNCVPKK